ncbi:hypothetical protein HMPREF0497_0658 [Lentilactobacillus buchneri ATCC 11577]|nr:hypothetical protein HMPREF0497_0658 [Lentilactobacillus buchneri ATCC 11577]
MSLFTTLLGVFFVCLIKEGSSAYFQLLTILVIFNQQNMPI